MGSASRAATLKPVHHSKQNAYTVIFLSKNDDKPNFLHHILSPNEVTFHINGTGIQNHAQLQALVLVISAS
jgi:hypothetical protein